jgi:outer membrane protein
MTILHRTLLLAVAAVLLASAAPEAQAQTRIGYTDYELIIVQMPQYREVQQQLQQIATSDREALSGMEQEIQQKFADYQSQAGVLSGEARGQREEEIVQMQTNLQQEQQRRLQALGQKESELLQPLFDRLQGAIDEVATARNLSVVLATRASSDPVLLFAGSDTVDITPEVMSKLGISMTQSGN